MRFNHCSFDIESNLVTLLIEVQNDFGDINVEEIKGDVFVDTNAEIDAIMNIDGGTIIMGIIIN